LRQVLGQVVENLPAVVAAGLRPGFRGVRRFDGVPDILAVSLGDLGQ